jgi:hypothetical protein
VNPNSPTNNRISLRDPIHYLDIVNIDGVAMAMSTHNDTLYYSFSKPPNAPCG